MQATRSDGVTGWEGHGGHGGGTGGAREGTRQEAAGSGSRAGGAQHELEVKPFKAMSGP